MRLRRSRQVVDSKEECAFHADGFCLLDDRECEQISRSAMRRYEGLSLSDYLELHRQRQQRRADLWFQWVSLMVSVLALCISVASLMRSQAVEAQVQPLARKSEVGKAREGVAPPSDGSVPLRRSAGSRGKIPIILQKP
jgi:hypothetical protein